MQSSSACDALRFLIHVCAKEVVPTVRSNDASRWSLLRALKSKLVEQADVVSGRTFEVPLPDGTLTCLPQMPLLPLTD